MPRTRSPKNLTAKVSVFLLAAAVISAALPGLTHALAAQQTPGDAFETKADKLLKHIRRAAEAEERAAPQPKKGQSEIDSLSKMAGVHRRVDNSVSVSVIVNLREASAAELRNAGFEVGSRFGDVATVETNVSRLDELASLSSVRKISAAKTLHPANDRARQSIGVDNVSGQRVVTQTGKGVVVGIIDTGIDFRHRDFTVPASNGQQTRIKALLDMTVYGAQEPNPGWNYSLPSQTSVIGRLYTEADINAALAAPKPADQNSDSVKERDKNGHGTHVAGSAAGNGLASPTPGTYAGMAPEADLVIVKASRENDGSDDFLETDVINAMQFVQQKAAELNEPFVINLSLGSQLGPHDGTEPDERAIDTLVSSGAGRAVCVAAGNDGDTSIHAKGTVPTGGSLTLNFNAALAPQAIDLYQSHSDRFSVTVTRPDGTTLGPVAYDPNGGQASDQYLQIYNANDDKSDMDAQNDQPEILIIFKAGAPTGNWQITLQDADSNPNVAFDAWAEGEDVKFTSSVDNYSHLIASPGTASAAITVGANVTRSQTFVLGSSAPFSSPGPTADERQKPDVSAPGYYLYSARSSDIADANFGIIGGGGDAPTDGTHYTGLGGTSMATPVTAGAVALMFQAYPTITSAQVRDSIIHSAAVVNLNGTWDSRYGFGKLNIAGAIGLGGRPTYTISGHFTTNDGNTQQRVTLSGSISGQTSVDSSGNYSFKNLPSGGNYTVTPGNYSNLYQYTYSPTGYTFNNLSANQAADFVETRVNYTISGRIATADGTGVPNLVVTMGMAPAPTTRTDANGNYAFTNLAAGQSYMIAPYTPQGYSFTPAFATVSNLSKNETLNFLATPDPRFSIRGRITDRSGKGVPDVSVGTEGGPSFTSSWSNSNGDYILAGLSPGTYKIRLYKLPYAFIPSEPIVNLTSDQTIDFTMVNTYYIGGKVVDQSGASVNGITMTLTGSQSGTYSTINGFYTFPYMPEGGTYTVTPSKAGYVFSPDSRTVTALSANTSNLDFVMSPVPNQIDDSRFFVHQHFLDFLNREPDQGGWDYWTGQITQCGANSQCIHDRRIGVSAAFYIELEFQKTGSVIYRMYRAAYGVMPNDPLLANISYQQFTADRPLINPDESLIQQSTINFANTFVQRAQFKSAYPDTLTNEQFVNKLYDTAGLTPYTNDRQQQINAMNSSGKTRAQVLLDVIEIPEFKNREFNRAFVLMQYFGYLRRDVDAGGYDFWLDVLNRLPSPNNFRNMVCAFLTSTEYQQRFGQTITRHNTDCSSN